ncbi:MAG: RNA polymerase sigma factor [Eubacteriales bacterium]
MKNQANPNPDREYKIYIPSAHQFITVTKEFYYEYYRPIWCTQKKAQKRGQCRCPKSKLWRCDGCCLDCSFYTSGNVWSLEYELELMGDIHEDPSADVESVVVDKIILQQLFKRLNELFPEACNIGELRMEGISDRDIADLVGIPRSTFRSRLEKVEELLRKKYGDII